jgi:hypothetical protein
LATGIFHENIFNVSNRDGQKILIKSSRGKIEFSYERSFDGRAYGRNQAKCVKGNVIRIS